MPTPSYSEWEALTARQCPASHARYSNVHAPNSTFGNSKHAELNTIYVYYRTITADGDPNHQHAISKHTHTMSKEIADSST